jgi:malate dehydrogenase (oxaloacetate-decarboxylating)(NADP+)
MDDDFRKAALDYHRLPQPGKLAIEPTECMVTQLGLSIAYSPPASCEAPRIARLEERSARPLRRGLPHLLITYRWGAPWLRHHS